MYQTKRSSKFIDSSSVERKKLRTTNRITLIEYLSNELFYEIFEYLDGCDIYKAFSNLNYRFYHLITCSPIPLRIRLHSKAKSELEYCCKNVIIPNRHNIVSFYFENGLFVDDFFRHCVIDSSFDRLESIVLGSISYEQLIILLFYLKCLPRLFSLTINDTEWEYNLSVVYRVIFSMPSLKYNKLSISSLVVDEKLHFTVPLAINERFSTIKYLIIDHNCTFNELLSILHHTPRLRHLTCSNLVASTTSIDIKKLVVLPNLIYLCIGYCQVEFGELEMFITELSCQLQVLNIKVFWSESSFDADRWERLIKKHIPHLQKFDYEYNSYLIYGFEASLFATKLNAFTSSFWIKRQWFSEVKIEGYEVIYSIHSYRKTWIDLHTNDETIASFNQLSNHNSAKHFIRPNQKHTNECSTQIITPIQLTINRIHEWEPTQSFINKFKLIFLAVQFTRLNFNCTNISIGMLARIIQLLPNLDSLKLPSLLSIEPGWLVSHDGEIFFSTSINNKITKVNFEKITDIEQVNFVFYICRHIKYFQVNIPEDMDPKTLIRFILIKANTYISHLNFLCIYISNGNEEMVSKLQNVINAEEILPHCTIKFISNRILVKCNCS